MNQPQVDRRIKFLGWGIIAVILILFAELGSFVIYKTVVLKRGGFLVYNGDPIPDSEAFKEKRRIRHPVLGWPPIKPSEDYNASDSRHDVSGSRPVPSFPTPGGELVSLYGDSFVYGSDVDNTAAWGNQLSIMLNSRVANFGVIGYGTDQAYLRYRDNTNDQAKVVFLGIYPLNVLRNVNQYRFLITSNGPFSFKPRFILEDGELRLVPYPIIPNDQIQHFADAPQDFLAHENFLPDSTYGPNRFSFPYSVSLVRLFLKPRTVNWLLDKPSWIDYIQPSHPSQSMEVTSAIVTRFQRDCLERGATLVTILIPMPSSYDWFLESGNLAMQALADDLQNNGIRVIDLIPIFAERLAGGSFCELLSHPAECRGHFNEQGNRMLAEILYDYLQTEKLLEEEGFEGAESFR